MYSSYSSSRPSEFSPQSAVTATDGSSWGGTDRRGGWNDQNVSVCVAVCLSPRSTNGIQSATHPSNYPSKPHTSTVSTAPELSAAEYTEPGLQTVQSPYPSASPYEPPAYHENYAKRDDHYQHQQQGLIAAGGWKTDGGNGNAYEGGGLVAEKPQKKILGLRRRWLVLLVLVFILVVVGAVVGGVLASRDSKSPDSTGVDAGKQGNTSGNGKGNDGTKPPTPSEDEDLKDKPNLPDPEIIAPESGLTVAGNELDGEVNMRLFFQSKSGRVNYVHYSTSARGWSKPEPLITIQPNSKMLAIDLVYTNGEPADRQINLYYIDPDRGCLQEYCTYIAKKPVVGDLSKNCRTGSVKPESSLSGYWPTIIFQTSTDGMVEYSQNFTRAASVFPWELETMGVDGIKSGSFSALPLHREYNHEGISVMYQKPDGKVAERIRPGPLGTSWTQGKRSQTRQLRLPCEWNISNARYRSTI